MNVRTSTVSKSEIGGCSQFSPYTIFVMLVVCVCARAHHEWYKLKALYFFPLVTQFHFAHKYHMCTKSAGHLCDQFWCTTKYCVYWSAAVMIQTASRIHLVVENILICHSDCILDISVGY
jgi:hypothetical protein